MDSVNVLVKNKSFEKENPTFKTGHIKFTSNERGYWFCFYFLLHLKYKNRLLKVDDP